MNGLNDELEVVLQDPLAAVSTAGGVGYVGLDFPPDLAAAMPVPCLHLPWYPGRSTVAADQWLESSFPGWARSILQSWSEGAFDSLHSVVFSRGDDASHRLYYYVRELQRRGRLAGPAAQVLDVARIPNERSRRHTRASVEALAARWDIDADKWRRGIVRTNALRRAFAALNANRAQGGAHAHRFARASLFTDVLPLLPSIAALTSQEGLRVLLCGSAPPDERLHDAVSRAGAQIVAETHGYGFGRLGPVLSAQVADPVGAVVDNLLARTGPRSFENPAQALGTALDATRIDAVVLWLTREDEASAWHVPALRRAVRERGLPLLELTARSWEAEDGSLLEIEEFVRTQMMVRSQLP